MKWQKLEIPRRALVLLGAMALVACGGNDGATGPEGPAGPSPDVEVVAVGPGTECPDGGVRVTIGDADSFVVCNGEDGQDGARGQDGTPGQPGDPGTDGDSPDVNVEPIDPDDEDQPCGDAGGLMVTVTVGDDTTVEYICNGEDGADGVVPEIAVEPIDSDADGPCGLAGGVEVTITTGDDTETFEVCNGEDGETPADGLTPEITLTDIEPDADGACGLAGGTLVTVTVGEDSESFEVCNGTDGESGVAPSITVETIAPDAEGACGLAGGTLVTVTTGEDSEFFEVCNGADGEDGDDGAASISVSEVDGVDGPCEGVGGVRIDLLDENQVPVSTTFVCNGAAGEDGDPGPAPTVTIDPADTQACEHGGSVVTIGEADPFTLCNGAPGDDGEPGTTPSITVETLAAGEEGCENGGYVLIVGTGEDEERYPLCLGEPGEDPVDPDPEIGGCAITSNPDVDAVPGDSLEATMEVFVDGVTGAQSGTRPDGYRAELGIGPVGSDPSADLDGWSFDDAALEDDPAEDNDEFSGSVADLEEGEFDFAFRVTLDDGATWVYCDAGMFNTTYDPSVAGRLTVVEPGDVPVVIAGWTFGSQLEGTWEGSELLNPNEGLASEDASALTLVGATPGEWAAGNEGSSASSTDWDEGAGIKYWQVQVNTEGFENLTVSSWQRSSNAGPRDFAVEVSLDGDAWTEVATVTVVNSAAGGTVDEAQIPAAFDNAETVWVRWLMTSNERVSGTTPVSPLGTSRIDSIRVRGTIQ